MSATAETVCNVCGATVAPWGCRRVALGWYCATNGLREDPARIRPGPVEDARISQDPEVSAAAAVLAAAEKRATAATAKFEAAALEHWRTRGRRASGSQTISVDGLLTSIIPPGTTDADIRRLREAEANLDAERQKAGEKVVQARQVLDEVRTRVRRKLARTR